VARIPIFGKGCPRDAFAPFLGYCYPHNYQNYCGYRITSLKIADSQHNSNSAVGLILTVTTSSIGAMLPAQCSCPPYSPKYFDPVPSVSGAACRYLSCVSQSYQTNGVIHEVALTNGLRTRANLIPVLVVGCGSAVPQQHTRLNHSIQKTCGSS
jgi:hypothetical protein